MFIERKNEMNTLNKIYNSDKFECIIVYGRRRVGKTELIKEFCKGKPHIFYTGQNNDRKLALEIFSQKIYNFFTESDLIDKDDTEQLHIIEYLRKNGIVCGYPDNSYKPKYIVIKAELIAILCKTACYVLPKESYIFPKQLLDYGWPSQYVTACIVNDVLSESECKDLSKSLSGYEAREIFLKAKNFFEERGFKIESNFDFLLTNKILTREELCIGMIYFQQNMPNYNFENWDCAMEYIANHIKNEKMILVIDEYQYLSEIELGLDSILQRIIDHKLKDSKIKLILMSSSMSINNGVLSQNNPLYGRVTKQVSVRPFKYYELNEYYKMYSSEERIILYSIFGGMPNLITKINRNNGIRENVINLILSQDSALYHEANNLLKEELEDYINYLKIFNCISNNKRIINEIVSETGMDKEFIKDRIRVLEKLDLLYKEKLISNSRKDEDYYKFKDNFVNFWLSFVNSNELLIETNRQEYLYDKQIEMKLSNYIGSNVFENICIEYLKRMQELGNFDDLFVFEEIGRCFWTSEERVEEEVDILAYSDKNAIFGECKWRNEPLNIGVYKKLVKKSQDKKFVGYINKYYFLFSKSGFTDEVIELAQSNNRIRLIGLDDLYKNV